MRAMSPLKDSRGREPETLSAERLDALLRRRGGRATRQRRAIYAALGEHHDHPTAETLHREVRRTVPGLSLATVYKALEVLVRAGAASRIVHSDGRARYDARTDEHDHRRCLGCGKVEDLDLPRRAHRVADLPDDTFQVTGYRLEILGYCETCARPPAAGADPSQEPRPTHETGETP
jgi:Fur family transcriptional regulator, peroxide stress response regulator